VRYLLTAAALAAAFIFGIMPAYAMRDCSGTVGTTSAPMLTGKPAPTAHFEVSNPQQNTHSLCINPIGTATCGASGTATIPPGGDKWWDAPDLPTAPHIVASGASTPYQCDYQ
jgi:hypothetical protein